MRSSIKNPHKFRNQPQTRISNNSLHARKNLTDFKQFPKTTHPPTQILDVKTNTPWQDFDSRSRDKRGFWVGDEMSFLVDVSGRRNGPFMSLLDEESVKGRRMISWDVQRKCRHWFWVMYSTFGKHTEIDGVPRENK